MTPALVILALIVAAGAVAAVSAREPRLAALGVLVTMIGAAFVADPLPGVLALAARVTGATLGGYLVWIALRGAPVPTAGWRLGWPGALAIAMVGFAIGWLSSGTIGTALGVAATDGPTIRAAAALAAGSPVPRAALGAAFALAALATAPVIVGRDVFRLGLGLLLLLTAAGLLRNAFAAGQDPIVELALAVLAASAGAAVAGLVSRSLTAHAALDLRTPGEPAPAVRHRPTDDANPRHLAVSSELARPVAIVGTPSRPPRRPAAPVQDPASVPDPASVTPSPRPRPREDPPT